MSVLPGAGSSGLRGLAALALVCHALLAPAPLLAADSVDEEDLTPEGARSANRAIFGNLQYEIGPAVTAGVELSHWTSRYPNAAPGTEKEPGDLRLQVSIQGSL